MPRKKPESGEMSKDLVEVLSRFMQATREVQAAGGSPVPIVIDDATQPFAVDEEVRMKQTEEVQEKVLRNRAKRRSQTANSQPKGPTQS